MIYIKSREEIALMRKAGRIAKGALTKALEAVRPGMTTLELDRIAGAFILKCGAKPSFYGYNGFPRNICVSVNDEVVHGVPGSRVIGEGDVVSIDCGAYYGGFHGDCADTALAGEASGSARRLVETTRESFYAGIKEAVSGKRVGDISEKVQAFVESRGFSVVRELEGHGVGASLHESPEVPNFGTAGRGSKLFAGMTIAVEPMVNMGGCEVYVDGNGQTYRTSDGKCSAHYENTILITHGEPVILTAL
jgi:methionyl aminopeptidase